MGSEKGTCEARGDEAAASRLGMQARHARRTHHAVLGRNHTMIGVRGGLRAGRAACCAGRAGTAVAGCARVGGRLGMRTTKLSSECTIFSSITAR